MGKNEVRFIVVWSDEDKLFHIDEDMAGLVFDDNDIWLPDSSEWVAAAYDYELYGKAFGLLSEKIGG